MELKTAHPETFPPLNLAGRNQVRGAEPGVPEVLALVARVQPHCRIEDKTWRCPAAPRRSVYKKSQSSSTPSLMNGAAVNPTRIPETDRSTAASMSTRAATNSHAIRHAARRSHRIFPVSPSHNDVEKPR